MKNKPLNWILFPLAGLSACSTSKKEEAVKPNILIILADDLGYGDPGYCPTSKLNTPNINYLAQTGLRFTRAYASSATSTPSRYALLTGSYPWRNEKASILPGDAPLIIDTTTETLPAMLRKAGYTTGIVGKWHLGLGNGNINWNSRISPSPNEVGFDYSFIMPATNDRVPCVYVENGYVIGLSPDDPLEVNYEKNFPGEPTALSHPQLCTKMKWHHGHNQSVHNGIPRIGFMRGGKTALWQDETMADTFVTRAKRFIFQNRHHPFFLYLALHQPHVPRVPHPRFAGKSGLGPRGDVILELDWCVGEIIRCLKDNNLDKNTLVIFTSDNGPVLNDGYYDEAVEKNGDHKPACYLRGGKSSLFEAGTRVPFITWWPGTITAGVSNAMVCQMDIIASLAGFLNMKNPSPDGENVMDALLGKSRQGRTELLLEANGKVAYRNRDYTYIPPYEGDVVSKNTKVETGLSKEPQLYFIQNDSSQQHNLAAQMPEKVRYFQQRMDSILHTGITKK